MGFDSFFTTVYFVVTNMTTVGYGDLVPITIPGKIISMINAMCGTFFMSLFIVTLKDVIQLDSDQ